ncbi:single-stranded DNA-binding protein [Azospirillum cavernae]|uniref:Single-stranded DNA-binding protein n=1 Tax=Azospirillum cavernae TaxID=2320860 RepID=A0A418W1C1_9PROT|nr:single-stranded DNA-binding protein [Azospirillum cavernae]RJF83759.1 single-stranded DNA-binding protein [Azospirillum cavernae]
MNVWTFTGRLGADGELRTTQSGEKVLGFRVANDVGFGERKTTQWVDCSIWGRRAESLAPHLTKGKQVVISGEVTLREFDKRDGTRGAGLSVRVAEIDFTGGAREEGGGGSYGGGGGGYEPRGEARSGGYGAGGSAGGGARSGGSAPPPRHDDLDDEIPF